MTQNVFVKHKHSRECHFRYGYCGAFSDGKYTAITAILYGGSQFYRSAEICHNSCRIQLPKVEESSTSVVGDKHPASCSLLGDRTTKISSFSMCVMAVNIST